DTLGRTGPVVVGVDGSGNSQQAVALAFTEAEIRGAEVVAVHAWSDASQFSLPTIEFQAVAEAEEALVSAALAGARQDHPDVPVQTVIVRDRPAQNIVEQAANAQLVVVGSHGRGGFKGMLIGSTSRAVVQNAECPVIVVRQRK
ncbi:MAG: universal stress protein, partial [Aldersonia sp.]|nr:universal stress protein [Aldersonia sp.]